MVVVFRTPVAVVLFNFETVDVRLATGFVVFTAVTVLVVVVAVVVLGAKVPTVLNLFVIAFELGLLVTVLVVVVDERVLLNVDGTVRGLAVGTVDEERTLVVVLDAPKAAVGDFVEVVDGFAVAALTVVVLDVLALLTLPLLVAELLTIVVDLVKVVGFFEAGPVFTSPLTLDIVIFLTVVGVFFSVKCLLVALPSALARPIVRVVDGLVALTDLVDDALLTAATVFLIVLVGSGFEVEESLVVARFTLGLVVLFSIIGAAGFTAFVVVVLDAVGLVVAEDLAVAFVVASLISLVGFNSSSVFSASGTVAT